MFSILFLLYCACIGYESSVFLPYLPVILYSVLNPGELLVICLFENVFDVGNTRWDKIIIVISKYVSIKSVSFILKLLFDFEQD